jgi:hypothetical protein
VGELIFFAVIVLFSILEAVAKRRKRREEGEEGGDEGESWTPAPVERQPRPKAERRPRVERGSSSSSDRGMPERGSGREERSETMIPADIWEEIAGLAGGEVPRPEPAPRKPKSVPRKPKPVPEARSGSAPRRWKPGPFDDEAVSVEKLEVERIEDDIRPVRTYTGARVPSIDAHPVHRSHIGYGTDPSERAPSEQDWRPSERGNRNAKRVRAMLRGSEGTDALKQAVILREVLGPPLSMKDG